MLGIRLFRHAVLMLLRNPLSALVVSVGPMSIAFGAETLFRELVSDAGLQAVFDITWMVFVVVGAFLFGWTAVAWHRYVLMEEHPQSYLPAWHEAEILRYIDATVRVGALWLLVYSVVLYLPAYAINASVDAEWLDDASWGLGTLASFLSGYIWLRFGLVLPAAALGHRMPLSVAWGRTKRYWPALIVVQLFLTSVLVLLEWIGATSAGTLAFDAFEYWFATMIGISVLTVIYGHIWEERAL